MDFSNYSCLILSFKVFLLFKIFIYLFGRTGSSLLFAGLTRVKVSGGYSVVAVHGLFIVVPSLVQSLVAAPGL